MSELKTVDEIIYKMHELLASQVILAHQKH